MFRKLMRYLKSLFAKKPAPPIMIDHTKDDDYDLEQKEPSKGQIKLAVVVGHTKKSPGATMAKPYGISEYPFNTEIAKLMQDIAVKQFPHIKVSLYFRDAGGIAGAYGQAIKDKSDCLIELHFNAYNGKAHGTSTLCTPDANDVDFTMIVHKKICAVFGREGMSRGISTRSKSDRGGNNVHSFPGGVNCLTEPAFGDNPVEAKMLMDKKEQYAKCMLEAVDLWARKVDLIK